MEKRKLIDLTTEELKDLYENNAFLQEKCKEYAMDNADFCLEELFRPFRNVRGLEWNIGYPGNYVKARYNIDYSAFFDGVLENYSFTICTEETRKLVERASKKVDFYMECSNGYTDISDKNFEMLEKWLDNAVEKACQDLKELAVGIYDYAFTKDAALESLDVFIDCNDYETDGTFLYETEVRKYA